MIHPFRDGNGRMAAACRLWSLPGKASSPLRCEHREIPRANTEAYYGSSPKLAKKLAAETRRSPWIRFVLNCSLRPGQTMVRCRGGRARWNLLTQEALKLQLPDDLFRRYSTRRFASDFATQTIAKWPKSMTQSQRDWPPGDAGMLAAKGERGVVSTSQPKAHGSRVDPSRTKANRGPVRDTAQRTLGL